MKKVSYVNLSSISFNHQSGGHSSASSKFASLRPRTYTSAVSLDNTEATETLNKEYLDELTIKLSSAACKRNWYEIGVKLGLKAEIWEKNKMRPL